MMASMSTRYIDWTSHLGILVFARDSDTARTLGLAMMAGDVAKTYLAMVRGWPPEQGEIDYPLREEPEDRRLKGIEQPVRNALTHYRTLATTEIPVEIEKYPTSRYAVVELSRKQAGSISCEGT